jgi:hypothetical protein
MSPIEEPSTNSSMCTISYVHCCQIQDNVVRNHHWHRSRRGQTLGRFVNPAVFPKRRFLCSSRLHHRVFTQTQCTNERPPCAMCLRRPSTCRYVEPEARQAGQKYKDLQNRRSVQEELLGLMRTLLDQKATDLFGRVHTVLCKTVLTLFAKDPYQPRMPLLHLANR